MEVKNLSDPNLIPYTAPLPYTHRSTQSHTEQLSVSPSVTQVCGSFPLMFRVSSASSLFLLQFVVTSRVLVNVGSFRHGAW